MDGNARGRRTLERIMDDLRNTPRIAAPKRHHFMRRDGRDSLVARARAELRLTRARRRR